jgi:hypothetical protein
VNPNPSFLRALAIGTCATLSLAGCGGGGDSGASGTGSGTGTGTSGTTYTVGGTVSGLAGTLALQLNGGTALSVTADGNFVFPTAVSGGTVYQVTIQTQPSGQTCVVGNASGNALANVSSVTVNCAAEKYTVGGTVSGLNGTVVLRNNGGDSLTVTTNGAFQFATAVTSFQLYSVTVGTQPAGQTCWVINGYAYSTVPVTNVEVRCAATIANATVGGGVTGLSSTGLVLRLSRNGTVAETLSALAVGATSFAFTTNLATGDAYVVSVATQPSSPRQNCTVANGTGYIGSASVGGVQVSCTTEFYTLGGRINVAGGGTLAAGLVLQNNLGDDLAVPVAASSFTFATPLTSPSTYAVSVKQQPAGQTCTLAAAQGVVIAGANISNVALDCVANALLTPLNGLYRVSVGGNALRGYLGLAADGTFLYGLHQESASCNSGTSNTNGNGVEYGVYHWDAATGAFRVVVAAVDTTDKCGLAGGGMLAQGALNSGAGGVLSGTLALPTGSSNVTLTPVASTTGQLLGGWTADRLGFVVYGSDSSLFSATSQVFQNTPGPLPGIEDGCLAGAVVTAATGAYTVNLGSGCSLGGGLGAVDTNGSAGWSASAGVSTTFEVSGDALVTRTGTQAAVATRRIASPN